MTASWRCMLVLWRNDFCFSKGVVLCILTIWLCSIIHYITVTDVLVCVGPVKGSQPPAPRNDEQSTSSYRSYSPLWSDFSVLLLQLLILWLFCLVIYAGLAFVTFLCACQSVVYWYFSHQAYFLKAHELLFNWIQAVWLYDYLSGSKSQLHQLYLTSNRD